jgi:hypothetical protein
MFPLQVAADLLKQYKAKFEGGALSVTWDYLRNSMGTYLSQTNPVVTHRDGHAHLRDPHFQLDAFQVRVCSFFMYLPENTSQPPASPQHTKTPLLSVLIGSFSCP